MTGKQVYDVRQVHFPALRREVSVLGFGCASLGSRISPAVGRQAVHRALDGGINWFDVAPPYGDGRAEDLLGEFLGTRRKEVVICTKFGIARPSVSPLKRLLRPIVQRVVARLPGLRTMARRSRPTGQRTPIDPASVESWITESLRRLKTDYIDVAALHEPSDTEAADERIHAVLDGLRRKGVIRAVSIAGSATCAAAAAAAGIIPDAAQFPDTPFDCAAPTIRLCGWAKLPLFVTHGVFGSGTLKRVQSLDASRAAALKTLATRYGLEGDQIEAAVLARFAFANNPDGVVIFSMFAPAHIDRNIASARAEPDQRFAAELRRILEAYTG